MRKVAASLLDDQILLWMVIKMFIDECEEDRTPMVKLPKPGAADLAAIELAKGWYAEYWEDWIKDKKCFLTPEEVNILEFFHDYYAGRESNRKLGVGLRPGRRALRGILRKMIDRYADYWDYEKGRQKELPGEVPENTAKHKFLHTPIRELNLSKRLLNCLLSNELNTMYEVVTGYSDADLLKIPGLGKNTLHELENILRDHGCEYMLGCDNY